MSELFALEKMRLDGGTQSRAVTDMDTVIKYAYDMEHGHVFPPVIVFYDGTDHWLADGFQRFKAAVELQWDRILADIRQGTRRDAILYSCGANAAHGLPRTNEDKRRAVRKLLEDEEWMSWSDVKIADIACVSHDFVSRLREELHPASFGERRIRQAERGGTVYPIDTTNLGRKPREPQQPGFREHEEHPRYMRTVEAMRSIVRAHDALPSPEEAVVDDPHFNAAVALKVSAWWNKLAQLLQRKTERAS